MYLLNNAIYQETRKLALGQTQKSPLLSDLSDWFMRTFSIKILNIEFGKLAATRRYRLYIILANSEDYQKINIQPNIFINEDYQNIIELEFRKLALTYRFAEETMLENLFITFNDFTMEAMTAANWSALIKLKPLLLSKYSIVWNVLAMFWGLVIFYYTDNDITANENNGINGEIIEIYYSLLKESDELNYFTREKISIKFDSKENLDNHYQGSMFYYAHS
jgi:hypothetical protein